MDKETREAFKRMENRLKRKEFNESAQEAEEAESLPARGEALPSMSAQMRQTGSFRGRLANAIMPKPEVIVEDGKVVWDESRAIALEPIDWEKGKRNWSVYGALMALIGFLGFVGMDILFSMMGIPKIIIYFFGIFFGMSLMGVLVFIFSNKGMRRALRDALWMNRTLSQVWYFAKNRRAHIWDVPIPPGTEFLKIKGVKMQDGKPLELHVAQTPHILSEGVRPLYTFKQNSRTNIDDYIANEVPAMDADESVLRELDYISAEKKVRMETQAKDWGKNLYIIMALIVIGVIIQIATNFIK